MELHCQYCQSRCTIDLKHCEQCGAPDPVDAASRDAYKRHQEQEEERRHARELERAKALKQSQADSCAHCGGPYTWSMPTWAIFVFFFGGGFFSFPALFVKEKKCSRCSASTGIYDFSTAKKVLWWIIGLMILFCFLSALAD